MNYKDIFGALSVVFFVCLPCIFCFWRLGYKVLFLTKNQKVNLLFFEYGFNVFGGFQAFLSLQIYGDRDKNRRGPSGVAS